MEDVFSSFMKKRPQKGAKMNEKKLSKKEKDFCQYYVRLRNPKESAQKAGYSVMPEYTALLLLTKKHIRKKITELEKENTANHNLVSAGFQRLAFGSVSDAVKLILAVGEKTSPDIDSLDLFNVSEIKYTCGKGMEVKFFDRLKALERLCEIADNESNHTSLSIYEALERSAKNSTEGDDCG